jgi:hypothetical protein
MRSASANHQPSAPAEAAARHLDPIEVRVRAERRIAWHQQDIWRNQWQ